MKSGIEFKITQIVSFILLGLCALLGVIFYINYKEEPMLYYSYVLVAISGVLAVIFTILGMFKSKKSMIGSLIVLGIAAVLVGIAYAFASDAMPSFFGVEAFDLNPTKLKLIDTSLILLYILTGISFIGLFYTEIVRTFK